MALPWACSAGVSFSFGAGGGAAAGGKAGSCFGPAGIVTGIVIGGILGWAAETYINRDKVHQYESLFDIETIGICLTKNNNPNQPLSPLGPNHNKNSQDPNDKEPNNIDQIDANKISHIQQPKHNWNKLVLDNNFGAIKNFIKEVMDTGTPRPRGVAQVRTKIISGEVVEVTYQAVDGINKISNAWVK